MWRASVFELMVGSLVRGARLPALSRKDTPKVQEEVQSTSNAIPQDAQVSDQLGEFEQALTLPEGASDRIGFAICDEAMTEEVTAWLSEQEPARCSQVPSIAVDDLFACMETAEIAKPVGTGQSTMADGRLPIDDSQSTMADPDWTTDDEPEAFFAALGDDDETAVQPLRAAADKPSGSPRRGLLENPVAAETPATPAESKPDLTAAVDQMLRNVDDVHDAFLRLQQQFAGIEHWCEELINA